MDHPRGTVRFELEAERVELPNGLVLLLCENHTTPSVSISAVVTAGSRLESDEKAGLGSLVGEMIDEGTTTRDSQQIAGSIEALGGRLGTFGDYQSSGVALFLLSKDVLVGLETAADLLRNATFPEDKLRQQIERRIAQIQSRLDVPRTRASDAFNEIIFEATPQHRPPIGYERTVSGLSRADIEGFFQLHYRPGRAIISIVGDIERRIIVEQVASLFGDWRGSGEPSWVDIRKPALQSRPIEHFIEAQKEQLNIFIGHVGIERANPDFHALLVMDTILGSSPGFTSRIPRALRDEQGLAYSTYANITSSAGVDAGRFVAYIGTSPENLHRALGGLRSEIVRIVEAPVTQPEIDIAKAYLTGSFVFKFQRNSQVAEFLIDAEVYGLGFDYTKTFPGLIEAITVDDITRVTRQYLHPDRLTTVVVGPTDAQRQPKEF